jgi:EmrB/QacA subfamily drug resistance transporter
MTNAVRSAAYRYRWTALAVVLLAECMDLIDSTVVNVAAPRISADFHASTTSLQWIVGGYPLAIAVGLILGGRLGDLVGRRRMFMIGTAGFVVASLLCGLSTSVGTLIAARLVQGSLAAMMLPQGFGIIRECFDDAEQQKAFGIFGPVIGLSAVLGPILGGALTSWNLIGSSWRLCFFINVPLGLAAILLGRRVLPASQPHRDVKLDVTGTALVAAFAVLIVYPLIQGREHGWPWWTWASMAAGVLLLVAFGFQQVRRDRRGADPLITPSLFGKRGYTTGLVFLMVFFSGMTGVLLCATLFLQIGQSYTPIHAALSLVPLTVGITIGAVLSGAALGPRFGRATLQGGVAVAGVGYALLALAMHGHGTVTIWGLLPGLFVGGLGVGLVVAPLFDIVLASVDERETGSASGVLNAGQNLAGSIGVAVLGTVFFDGIGAGDFHEALRRVLLVQLGLVVLMLVLSPMLPRRAREEAAVGETPVAADQTPMTGLSR